MNNDKLLAQKIFQIGLFTSVAFVLIGLFYYLAKEGSYSIGKRESLLNVFKSFSLTNPISILYLGITMLVLTPIITMLILTCYYALRKDRIALTALLSFLTIVSLILLRLCLG